jgi:phosphoribosyl-dephospho-CoA transferase
MGSDSALRVHDLLWIREDAELLSPDEPAWIQNALEQAAVVVVRRAEAPPKFISVGIRGHSRAHRHAAFLRRSDMLACRTPESLASEKTWRKVSTAISPGLRTALKIVTGFSEREHLVWGPIGSVGYQLATGMQATSDTSDLDVLVRCGDFPNRALLRAFHDAIRPCVVRVDVILEGPQGAVALEEYLQNRNALIKTNRGPRFGTFPGQVSGDQASARINWI